MLASERLIKAFNEQIGKEMHASMQYVAVASYHSGEALPQLAKLFYAQADEEREHAMRFVRFVVDVEGRVVVPAIPAPKCDFTSVEETVALSLEWERTVTEQIYGLVDIANEESNYIAQRFLDFFVNEQLEEVNKMSTLLSLVRRAGDNLLFIEEYVARGDADGSAPAPG